MAVVGVRLFDGEQVLDGVTVVLDGDRISAVGVGVEVPPGAEVVDGTGRTLLPGLIDAHTHCRGREALAAAAVLGVTTELDLMCDPKAAEALRQAARTEPIADFRSAGNPVTVAGGHGTEYGRPIPTLDRAEDTEDFVSARLAEGSDFLKIILDDGSAFGRSMPTLTGEEVQRAVAAAHAHDRLAVVHIASADEARTAIEAGADGLAHLYVGGAEPELAAQIAAKHAFVVPTLSVLHSICEPGVVGARLAADPRLQPFLGPATVTQLRGGFRRRPSDCSGFAAGVAALKAAGATLLAGSDAPNPGTAHGVSLHGELALLVEASLTPIEALVAATSAPAQAFGLDDRGRIAVGMRADVLLVAGDPTRDVTATRDIVAVWVRGQGVKRNPAPVAPKGVGGLVSDFEDGASTRFGSGWTSTTDQSVGGSSVASIRAEDGALSIDGEVHPGPGLWAGAWFTPGASATDPVDLSGPNAAVTLRVRGDPGAYAVMLFTATGRFGALQPIDVGKDWAPVRLPFTAFGVTGSGLRGLFVGSKRVGPFHLEIDDVTLGP